VTEDIEAVLERGRTALAECDWAAARTCFDRALAAGPETAAALDGLGQALYWQGEYPRALRLRTRAYAVHRRDGDLRAAALVAAQLAALHLWIHGNRAACGGWLGHAERLLEDQGDCRERAWLELVLASTAHDDRERERRARHVVELARHLDEPGLEYDALAQVGLVLVARGQVPEGMRLIDEAVAAATGGVVTDPWPMGEIYCALFGACELAIDVHRAESWLAVVHDYVARTGELPVSAICRMHYGGVLAAAGRWADAEQELRAAIDLYDRTWRGSRSGAVLRLAELRARQGRLGEARRLVAGCEDWPDAAATLARLHFADGQPALAQTVLERCLVRRGRGLPSAPLLALLVEARLAGDQPDTAAEIAEELGALAAATAQQAVSGLAAMARGRVAVATGTPDAVVDLEDALAAFSEAGLPYELARTRTELARHLSTTRPDVARAEAVAALATFDELGATADADAATALLRELGGTGTRSWPRSSGRALTKRESEVLSLLAEGRTNAEIASALFISLRTAEDHVSNILTKLGVGNRTEAAAHALRTQSHRPHA
jgi:DNA-binding CsgD family transcriptional regulator